MLPSYSCSRGRDMGEIVYCGLPSQARQQCLGATAVFLLLVAHEAVAQSSDAPLLRGKAIYRGETGAIQGHARLFNATSCEACHGDGSGGIGPKGDGLLPTALVVQLESPSDSYGAEGAGDPVYGRILNTHAADGVQAEGVVTVRYSEIEGHYYPAAFRWRMRTPHYRFTGLRGGPLAASTVIKPRLAPPLHGATLLEAVPESTITQPRTAHSNDRPSGEPAWRLYRGARVVGRFGWQAASVSIRDQTTKAFAREMGLISSDQPFDDCTAAEADCLRQRSSGTPAISDESLDAVLAYLRSLRPPASPPVHSEQYLPGLSLFTDLGCAACHRPELPVDLAESANGGATHAVISPYTDLRLHDLGVELADRTVSGASVVSKWRTAPLWGLGYRNRSQSSITLLHDGRARSVEEAILWHSGEAGEARQKFMALPRRYREALLRWLEAL